MCSIISRRLNFSSANLHLLKSIHTSQPRQFIDVLTFVTAGHYFQTIWPNIGFYYKCAAVALPAVTTGYFATHCYLRCKYDHLLQRKKLALSPRFGYKASLAMKQMLGGPPVVAVNRLLKEILESNSLEFALKDPLYQWQVFVFEKANDWYDLNEGGQMFLSKEILLMLSKNELTAFMTIQMAHILAKHKTEVNSFSLAANYTLSCVFGMYAFLAPRIVNFPVDLAILVILHQLTGYTISQLKYRSLLVEADKLALRLAKNCQTNENDFISLFEKLTKARGKLPWTQKFSAYCFYNHRIKKFQSYLKQEKEHAS